MPGDNEVSAHYLHGNLLNTIQSSLAQIGKTTDNVTIEDLSAVDEFHIGGRLATENLMAQLNFSANDHLLDVGCGLGGAARYIASQYKNQVTGIDLTREYIDTGKDMCSWVKLDTKVTLRHGSATEMPFEDESFDGGFMLHVGMNIEDKDQLFKEIYRVLRPGSSFGVYDVMRHKDGELNYPVPWATDTATCHVATPEQYKQTLLAAGFDIINENDRRDFALEFFRKLQEKMQASGGPPPLGLHTLMKASTPIKINNMINNITTGYVGPVEIIVQKY